MDTQKFIDVGNTMSDVLVPWSEFAECGERDPSLTAADDDPISRNVEYRFVSGTAIAYGEFVAVTTQLSTGWSRQLRALYRQAVYHAHRIDGQGEQFVEGRGRAIDNLCQTVEELKSHVEECIGSAEEEWNRVRIDEKRKRREAISHCHGVWESFYKYVASHHGFFEDELRFDDDRTVFPEDIEWIIDVLRYGVATFDLILAGEEVASQIAVDYHRARRSLDFDARSELHRLLSAYDIDDLSQLSDQQVSDRIKKNSNKQVQDRCYRLWEVVRRSRSIASAAQTPELVAPVAAMEVSPKLNESEQAIVDALRECGSRLTTEPLLKRALGLSNSNGKAILSGLVKRGIIDNRNDCKPRGYGFPGWI